MHQYHHLLDARILGTRTTGVQVLATVDILCFHPQLTTWFPRSGDRALGLTLSWVSFVQSYIHVLVDDVLGQSGL